MSFNLQDYEPVEDRIRRFYKEYPDGRITTEWVDFAQEENKPWRFMFKATIYLSADDHEKRLPKATGYASEMETGKQAQWAAELAETSSIGRALANMNLSGNKRATREEMEKVAREQAQKRDWIGEAESLALVYDANGLRKLYSEAVANRALPDIIEKIKAYGTDVASGSQDTSSQPGGSKGTA
jgi:hypothetical protein